MSNDTRPPENNQSPDERKPQPWRRRALTSAAVVGVVVTAIAYPPVAVPLGLGLAALQLLRHK